MLDKKVTVSIAWFFYKCMFTLRGLREFVWFRRGQKCPLVFVMGRLHASLTSRRSMKRSHLFQNGAAEQKSLWRPGLNDISEVQRSFPNQRYEAFPGLCGVLKCECMYNPAWVIMDTEGCNLAKLQMNSHLAKLQVSRNEVEGRSEKSVTQ